MFGHGDESGEPGIKKYENDYFFCKIIFKNKRVIRKALDRIADFRKNHSLSVDHEFHYATDSKKTRTAFIKLIQNLDFEFLSVSLKKGNTRKAASFAKMGRLVLELMESKKISATIIMDINPNLYSKLRKNKKHYNIVLHISEHKSQSNDLIQVADYVTAIRTRYLKYPGRKQVAEIYDNISEKLIGFMEQ